jgi:alpha-ketoglutarate-dependent taurine dioxygenase
MDSAVCHYPAAARIALADYSAAWDELDGLIEAGITYRNYSPARVGGQQAAGLADRVAQLLADPEQGFAVLDLARSLDADSRAADKARLLILALGNRFGQTVTKNHLEDSPFFSVFVRPEGKGGVYIGNALSNNRPGIHTDGSALPDARVDFMALLCIRPAAEGGESIVVNAVRVFRDLPAELQGFLLRREFIRQNPYDPKSPHVVRRPIYNQVQTPLYSGLGIQYHRTRIEGGHERLREALTAQDHGALKALDCSLSSAQNMETFKLRSGVALLVNNHVMCHDRTAFKDTAEHPRLLERYWAGAYIGEQPRT